MFCVCYFALKHSSAVEKLYLILLIVDFILLHRSGRERAVRGMFLAAVMWHVRVRCDPAIRNPAVELSNNPGPVDHGSRC